MELQDTPVNVCNFYHGELGAFGIFSEQGVPLKVYQALRAFHGLMETPRRVATRGAVAGKLAFVGGLSTDGREATLLVSNFADPRSDIVVNWKSFDWTGGVTAEIHTVDSENDFAAVRSETIVGENPALHLTLKAPSLAMIRLRPTDGASARRTLSVASPANRLVFQRNLEGNATIPVAGTCAWPGAAVEARVVDADTSKPGEWASLGTVQPDFDLPGRAVGCGRLVFDGSPCASRR